MARYETRAQVLLLFLVAFVASLVVLKVIQAEASRRYTKDEDVLVVLVHDENRDDQEFKRERMSRISSWMRAASDFRLGVRHFFGIEEVEQNENNETLEEGENRSKRVRRSTSELDDMTDLSNASISELEEQLLTSALQKRQIRDLSAKIALLSAKDDLVLAILDKFNKKHPLPPVAAFADGNNNGGNEDNFDALDVVCQSKAETMLTVLLTTMANLGLLAVVLACRNFCIEFKQTKGFSFETLDEEDEVGPKRVRSFIDVKLEHE